MSNNIQPFHLAVPVNNLEKCKRFYEDVLGCEPGRSDTHWADYDFFGHQLVLHYKDEKKKDATHNPVDGKHVPVPHFGVVLLWEDFDILEKQLRSKNVSFIIEPYIRFEGQVGEQKTMFFYDPSFNALEFKTFKNQEFLFKS